MEVCSVETGFLFILLDVSPVLDYDKYDMEEEEEERGIPMDVRDYEYIVAIAEQGSITRAAAQLFITQSALTKFLQRTERELGIALFQRNGNQFLLTEAGRQYVETGRAIMYLDRQLSEKLSQELLVEKSRIRLGFSMGRTKDILQNIVPVFLEKYPDIQLHTKADTSRKQMIALQNDQLDLALVTNVERVPGYCYIPAEKSQMVLAVSADSPLLAESKEREGYSFPVIEKSKLNGVPFVSLPAYTNSGNIVKELWKRYDIKPNVRLEVSDVRSLVDAVECGLGAAMFMSIPDGEKKIQYLSVEDMESLEQTAMLVYRMDKNCSKPMEYLIELLTNKNIP